MSAEDKLARIAAIINEDEGAVAPAGAVHYNNPELSVNDVVADGLTVNRDGSRWATSRGESGPAGTKFRLEYGFISSGKNPKTWDALKAAFGPDMWSRWNGTRNPWTIYKADPGSLVESGANPVTLAQLLQSVEIYQP